MFRLVRFSFRFVGRGGFFSRGGGDRRSILEFRKTYRSTVKSEETAAFHYDDDSNGIEEREEIFEFQYRLQHCPIKWPLVHLIKSYGENIDWKELIKKCMKIPSSQRLKEEVVKTYIVGVCESEELFDALTSYFKYLVNSGELCAGALYLMCCIINKHQEELEECVDIMYDIYRRLPPEQELPLNMCSIILQHSEKYKQKLLHEVVRSNVAILSEINQSIASNDIETAVKVLSLYPENINLVLKKLFLHLQNLASSQELPVSKIVLILDMIRNCNITEIPEEALQQLNQLMAMLQNLDNSYHWCFKEVKVKDVCSFCSGKLKKVEISDGEIEQLKETFKENVIFGTNINIRSSHEEWDKFINYINKKSYDIVIDGLNVTKTYMNDPTLFSKLLNKLNKLELTPLILARQHFNTSVEYKMVHKSYPVFLTQDLSHDDVFVVYAALHKGKNCYILTADQMGFALKEMQNWSLHSIYRRWQILHQAVTRLGGLVLPHGLDIGFQKTESESEDEFRYHLVVKDGSFRKMYCISRLKNHGMPV